MNATNSLELVLVELVSMFNNGITLKNIKNSLLNKGVSEELANTLVRLTELKTK